jgi:phage-related protein
MLDLLAKTKGYNATQEDAVNIANMIGKAMTGNAGALSRVGITMTEAEKDAIKFGDANQRAAIIAKVLQSNVGGVNAAMAKTAQGRQQQAMNAYGDMLEEFGKKLLPIRADLWGAFGEVLPEIQNAMMPVFDMLAQWFKDILPDVKEFIKELAKALPGAVQTVISVFNTLGPVLKGVWNTLKMLSPVIAGVVAGFTAFNIIKTVIAGFQMLQPVIMLARNATLLFNIAMSLNPLGMIVIAIGLVVAALVALYNNWDKIVAYFGPTVQAISGWFKKAWESIKTVAENVWNGIVDSFTGCINRLKGMWESFKNALSSPIDTVIRARKEQIAAGQNATGTSYFPGGWTHVNEGGRGELINLPSGSQIVPHDLSVAASNTKPSISINLNIAGNVIGNDDFYNECGRVISQRVIAALGNM